MFQALHHPGLALPEALCVPGSINNRLGVDVDDPIWSSRIDARAHSLAASKTTDFEEIKAFSGIALHIARESAMHVEVGPRSFDFRFSYD
jgi:hypothetical protein